MTKRPSGTVTTSAEWYRSSRSSVVEKGMEPLVDPSVESHKVATSPKGEPVQIDRGCPRGVRGPLV